MSDVTIVLKDGRRINTVTHNAPDLSAVRDTLYNRSQAPSKREVRTASGRNGRKAYNGRKALQRASQPPTDPASKPNTAPKRRTAYNANAHTDVNDPYNPTRKNRNDLSASPFKDSPRGVRRSMYTTW